MTQGEKFKKALEARGIEKTEAARMIGVERVTLYQMFKSKKLRKNTLEKIIATFGIKEEELLAEIHTQFTTHNDTVHQSHEIEKLEIKISGLENELRWAKEALKGKDQVIQSLQAQLDQQSKKRDPRLEDGGSTVPARRD